MNGSDRLGVCFVLLMTAAGCGSGVTGSDSQAGTPTPSPSPESMRPRDAAPHRASGGDLIYHGGPVVSSSTLYAIWWGSSGFPADEQDGIDTLLGGFDGSSYFDVTSQYMFLDGGNTATAFGANLYDSSSPPRHGPSTSTIAAEVCSVLTANGLAPSSSDLYLVYTSNFPHGTSYCAYHSHGACGGTTIAFAYLPNLAAVGGCNPGNLFDCNAYSEGTRADANATAHELAEMVTDPLLDAWYDPSGEEIGDKCNFQFGSCVTLGKTSWQLQELWSNAAGGCVQSE